MDFMTWQVMSVSGHLLIMIVVVRFFGAGRGAMIRSMSARLTVAAAALPPTIATTVTDSVASSKKVTLCPFTLLPFSAIKLGFCVGEWVRFLVKILTSLRLTRLCPTHRQAKGDENPRNYVTL